MKAWVLHGANDLRREEVERPVLEAGEVRILVKAAGICGSDIPRIYQTGAHTHPLIPGHEFSGMVEALGSGVDPVWLGRRVGVFRLSPAGNVCRVRSSNMKCADIIVIWVPGGTAALANTRQFRSGICFCCRTA